MKNDILYDSDCFIYPGAYVPLLKEEDAVKELRCLNEIEKVLPPVNITELPDLFKVEVAIPGVNREDFLILADEHVLSVCAFHAEEGPGEGERIQMHEFNYAYFDRHIILPDNADAEFVSAEYKAGILRFFVPKTSQPFTNLHTRIIVY